MYTLINLNVCSKHKEILLVIIRYPSVLCSEIVAEVKVTGGVAQVVTCLTVEEQSSIAVPRCSSVPNRTWLSHLHHWGKTTGLAKSCK